MREQKIQSWKWKLFLHSTDFKFNLKINVFLRQNLLGRLTRVLYLPLIAKLLASWATSAIIRPKLFFLKKECLASWATDWTIRQDCFFPKKYNHKNFGLLGCIGSGGQKIFKVFWKENFSKRSGPIVLTCGPEGQNFCKKKKCKNNSGMIMVALFYLKQVKAVSTAIAVITVRW